MHITKKMIVIFLWIAMLMSILPVAYAASDTIQKQRKIGSFDYRFFVLKTKKLLSL